MGRVTRQGVPLKVEGSQGVCSFTSPCGFRPPEALGDADAAWRCSGARAPVERGGAAALPRPGAQQARVRWAARLAPPSALLPCNRAALRPRSPLARLAACTALPGAEGAQVMVVLRSLARRCASCLPRPSLAPARPAQWPRTAGSTYLEERAPPSVPPQRQRPLALPGL